MIGSVPPAIIHEIEAHTNSSVAAFSFASGGCINQGGKVTTSRGTYFLKWNDLGQFPGMFAAEAKGLNLLQAADALMTPQVIVSGSAGSHQFLLLRAHRRGYPRTGLLEAVRSRACNPASEDGGRARARS